MLSQTIQLFSGDQLLSLLLTLYLSLAQFRASVDVLKFTAFQNETWLFGVSYFKQQYALHRYAIRWPCSKCPTPYSWLSYSECLNPYSRVSYSECPTPYSRVSYSECPTPYKCVLRRIDTIRSPVSQKNPTPAGADLRSQRVLICYRQ